MKYHVGISIGFILLSSFLHGMEEEGVIKKSSGKDNVPSLYIVTTIPDGDEEVKAEVVSSSNGEEEHDLTDDEITDMLYEKFKKQFPDNPDIASKVNEIATEFCGKHDDVRNVLRRTRGSPRFNEREYKKKMAELKLEALKGGILKMKEESEREHERLRQEQQRLSQEKQNARSTLRLGYCNLALSAALGITTAGISMATFIALLASGCSE